MDDSANRIFEFVAEKAPQESVPKQIQLYSALEDLIPDQGMRERIRTIVTDLKKVESNSNQILLDFRERLHR